MCKGTWGCSLCFRYYGWEGSAWCCGETRKTREEADVHCNIEEHAICLSVAEALAFGICFAERAAGCEGVLRAAGFEVVCWRRLDVCGDTAARRGCWCAVAESVMTRYAAVPGSSTYGERLDTRVDETKVDDGCTGVADDDGFTGAGDDDDDDDGLTGVGDEESEDVGVGVGVGVGLGVADG